MIRFFIAAVVAAASTVSAPSSWSQSEGSENTATIDDRKARIRELVARDAGQITALEPSTMKNGGVLIGYSSGTLLSCDADQVCHEFSGTPNIPVESIAASARGTTEVVWLSYAQGALYQCEDRLCVKLVRDDTLSGVTARSR